jgi:putative ABC transport system permease protein
MSSHLTTNTLPMPVLHPEASQHAQPKPVQKRATLLQRFRTMAKVGIRMMFFDKLKLIGTLVGVVFAVVLSNQQLGTFLGLIYKNQMIVERADVDLWVIPTGAETFGPGKVLPMSDAFQARTVPGVAWADAMLLGAGTIHLPAGGTEAVTIIGLQAPHYSSGPWNVVAGGREVLNRPDTMIFEDGDRDVLGGLNVGSVREVNGRNITVGGFTWGMIPFGPSYAVADYELARELLNVPNDRANYIAVKLAPDADLGTVQKALQERVGTSQVVSKVQFKKTIMNYILQKTAIGITFGTSTLFAVIVGFVIVSLSMFSAVVDNIREFGTLKALGSTNFDLALLLLVQSVVYGIVGSIFGLALVSQMAKGIRSAKLTMVTPIWLTTGTVGFMIILCCFASSLALLRLRKIEPAMVFR